MIFRNLGLWYKDRLWGRHISLCADVTKRIKPFVLHQVSQHPAVC